MALSFFCVERVVKLELGAVTRGGDSGGYFVIDFDALVEGDEAHDVEKPVGSSQSPITFPFFLK